MKQKLQNADGSGRLYRIGTMLLALLVASSFLVAPVAAATIVDETVEIDDDTQTVWAEIEGNMTGTNTSEFTVTFTGVNSSDDSNATLQETNVTVEGNETVVEDYSLTDSDLEEYDEVDVEIEGTEADANATDYGKTVSVSGGGGGSSSDGLLSYSIYGIPAVAVLIVALGGAFLYTRD